MINSYKGLKTEKERIQASVRVELRQSIITMQLQSSDRQNLMSNLQQSDGQSLECNETLTDSFSTNNENRFKCCRCKCSCNLQDLLQDPIEKKRQKRREYKLRQKQRRKQEKDKALISLQRIIRDIYSLRTNFRRAQGQIQQCLAVGNNRQILCECINKVIKDEVEFIRRQITLILSRYQQLPEGRQNEAVRAVFAPIERIVAASAEIEEIINVFMASYSVEQEKPLQKNFGRTTLKFLVKADLYKSVAFNKICQYIFQQPPESYPRQRALFNYMMAPYERYLESNDAELDCSQSEEDTEQFDEEDDSWEEQLSTIQSPKNQFVQTEERQPEQIADRSRKRRKERRRKLKEETQCDFESILKRTQQINVDQRYRTACNVSEEWISRISKLKWKYTKRQRQSE